jgi:AraC-like DNA-binding protein
MGSEIKIIDILIYSNLLIVPLSLFLMVVKNKFSNYFFATQFVFYQLSIYFLSVLYFLISIKTIKIGFLGLYVSACLFFSSGCILYYLINKTVLLKKLKFQKRYLLHLIPVLFIVAYLFKSYNNSIEFKSNNVLLNYDELIILMYFQGKSNILIVLRFLFPLIYMFLPIRLLVIYLRKTSIVIYPDQVKRFLLVLFISRITNFICFLVAIFGCFNEFMFIDDVAKILFFVASLITPFYIIANPKIISVVTNFIVDAKKKENSQVENKDVFSILNSIITSNNLFLNSNYSIVNLSADSNISIVKIRETLKESGCNNYSEFINTYKINYANSLILDGYLDKFSIESLSKESGFQSEVTFYRIFKKINGCTPKEFKNKEDLNFAYE